MDISEFRKSPGKHYRTYKGTDGNKHTSNTQSEFFMYRCIPTLNNRSETLGLRKFDTNGGLNHLSFPSSDLGEKIAATRSTKFRLDDAKCKGEARQAVGQKLQEEREEGEGLG